MVTAELRQARTPPYAMLTSVVANGALMMAAWFALPRAWLFTLTGTAVFPLILASWMYADVLATNVLRPGDGRLLSDPEAAGAAVDEVRRVLRARALVLWAVITLPCLVAALVTGLVDRRPLATAATMVGVLLLPVGPLLLAGCVGLVFPYRARPLRWRWARRRSWRRQLRWLALAITPYAVVPFLLTLTTAPSAVVWRRLRLPRGAAVPDLQLAGLVGLACATSLVMAVVGDRAVRILLLRRRRVLAVRLLDPTMD